MLKIKELGKLCANTWSTRTPSCLYCPEVVGSISLSGRGFSLIPGTSPPVATGISLFQRSRVKFQGVTFLKDILHESRLLQTTFLECCLCADSRSHPSLVIMGVCRVHHRPWGSQRDSIWRSCLPCSWELHAVKVAKKGNQGEDVARNWRFDKDDSLVASVWVRCHPYQQMALAVGKAFVTILKFCIHHLVEDQKIDQDGSPMFVWTWGSGPVVILSSCFLIAGSLSTTGSCRVVKKYSRGLRGFVVLTWCLVLLS